MSPKKQFSAGRRFSFWLVYVVLLVFFVELTFRGYFAFKFKNSRVLLQPFTVIEHYEPGVLDLLDKDISNTDEKLDILLLGGSVLNELWGNIPQELENQLQRATDRPFEIYNLATPARTSRDSMLKFKMLKEKQFDIVVLYHGINEVRFNHCPADVFKTDYSHVDFYAKANTIFENTWSRYSILPLVYVQLKTNILKTYAENHFMPFHAPVKSKHQDWIEYGSSVKTKPVFKENYQYIISESLKRGNEIIVPQFAYFIPGNYSLSAFENKALSYGTHRNPVELWGTVETVSAGIDAHNEVIGKLQSVYGLTFMDMNQVVPKDKDHYDDLCHLSASGSRIFAKALIEKMPIQKADSERMAP